MLTLNRLTPKLKKYQAQPDVFQPGMRRAAVAMVLHGDETSPQLLMMQRSIFEGDPWSGHMAFPGGRVEETDASPLDAAIREAQEELGIELDSQAELITSLSEFQATSKRHDVNMAVKPFIFRAKQSLSFTPNGEVAAVVSIPLDYLLNNSNRVDFTKEFYGKEYTYSSYLYGEYRVWGLSLRFIDEMLAILQPS